MRTRREWSAASHASRADINFGDDGGGHEFVTLVLPKGGLLKRVSGIWTRAGDGQFFGHSLRIGGASFYLARGVSVEIVRMLGRWKTVAYELYVRAFEMIAPQHLAMRVLL